MTTASVFAFIALLLLIINVILSLRNDERTAVIRPRSKCAQIIWSVTWIAMMLLWFATRSDFLTTSTYLAILFGLFSLMQLSEFLGNLKRK